MDSGAVLVVKTHFTGKPKWTAVDQPVEKKQVSRVNVPQNRG